MATRVERARLAAVGEVVEGGIEAGRVEQLMFDLIAEREAIHLDLPQVVHLWGGAILAEPTDHLSGADEGIVALVRRRAVTGCALDMETLPADALFGDVDGDRLAVVGLGGESAELGKDVVTGNGVPVVVCDPSGAQVPSGFLIGDAEVDEVTLRPEVGGCQMLVGDCHGRRETQHVDRTPAPDFAVDEFAPERVLGPPIGGDGHHVGVAHQTDRGSVGVGSLDACHHRLASWGGLIGLDVETGAFEVGLQQV